MLKGVLKFSLKSFLVFLVIAVTGGLGHFFVLEPTEINGRSMEDALLDKDIIAIEKLSLLFSKPRRGQIVSIFDESSNFLLVKRIIGLPGEQVIIKRGKVFIVDSEGIESQLDEPYLKDGTATSGQNGQETTYPPLAKHEYFVLGDNRSRSTDSRTTGPVHRSNIIGVVKRLFSN